MADPTLLEIMAALADQIRDELTTEIPEIQVEPGLITNPTPPAIDIYPATPFQEHIAYGPGNNALYFLVRARVNTPDHQGAQDMLLSLMDPRADSSIELAIASDVTLNSNVEYAAVVDGPSDYSIFVDAGGQGLYLGCTWTVQVIP